MLWIELIPRLARLSYACMLTDVDWAHRIITYFPVWTQVGRSQYQESGSQGGNKESQGCSTISATTHGNNTMATLRLGCSGESSCGWNETYQSVYEFQKDRCKERQGWSDSRGFWCLIEVRVEQKSCSVWHGENQEGHLATVMKVRSLSVPSLAPQPPKPYVKDTN